ncbi:hypothetical protein J1N35_010411 [Gossypium stocksii]|uniref:Uncharacterized protein n=1 Tax=Gossypium stocksii TaxID=47602 RepID=A0A9D3W1S2_9ROSI|nr:hypothetical protein J1N35_010411 [Gossypium stocksii]
MVSFDFLCGLIGFCQFAFAYNGTYEKLKEKKAKYEAIASTDSSVNHEDIDKRIINEVLGPKRYGQVRFQGSDVTPT